MTAPGTSPTVGLITFDQTAWSLRVHHRLGALGFAVQIMPIPRKLSASCGLAVRFPLELEDKIRQILQDDKVQYHDIVHWMEE